MNIIITLLILGVIIFIHELGHFLAARHFNIPVKEFSIGMGPEIFTHTGEKTIYRVRGIPIGGFVDIAGMNPNEDEEDGFNNRSKLPRFIVLIAGVGMNFLLTYVLILGIIMFAGEMIPSNEPVVGEIIEGTVAEEVLQVGDKIVEIEQTPIAKWEDIHTVLSKIENGNIQLTIERDEQIKNIETELNYDEKTEKYYFGIYQKFEHKRYNIFEGIVKSGENFMQMFVLIFQGLRMLVTGGVEAGEVSGPVGTVRIVGEFVQYGFLSILYLTAILSINVGIFNLLPFPALDGGRLIFIVLEMFKVKIDKKVEENVHRSGIVFLLFLMLMVTFNDVRNLF